MRVLLATPLALDESLFRPSSCPPRPCVCSNARIGRFSPQCSSFLPVHALETAAVYQIKALVGLLVIRPALGADCRGPLRQDAFTTARCVCWVSWKGVRRCIALQDSWEVRGF
ncbi:hypothetical protein KM043_003564 [Ampulex compressa]|nr:hypothetical protein KM043_003564 [Ampulex compressa]